MNNMCSVFPCRNVHDHEVWQLKHNQQVLNHYSVYGQVYGPSLYLFTLTMLRPKNDEPKIKWLLLEKTSDSSRDKKLNNQLFAEMNLIELSNWFTEN